MTEPPKQDSTGKWFTDNIIPICLSLLALAVSIFAFIDQHSVDSTAAEANKEQYARLVSASLFFPVQSSQVTLTVQNLGVEPITTVGLEIRNEQVNGPFNGKHVDRTIDDVPPCSIRTLILSQNTLKILGGWGNTDRDAIYSVVNHFSFVDATGIEWDRDNLGTLTVNNPADATIFESSVFASTTLTPARGCL